MASIYKKKGTKNLYCCYCDADGRRVHRSTGKAKRGDALREAMKWEDDERKIMTAEDEDARVIYALVAEAGDLAAKGGLTLDKARDLVGRMMVVKGLDAPEYYTVRGWMAEWIEQKEGSASESSMKTYRHAVTKFVGSLKDAADRGLEHLTDKDIRTFRDGEKKLGKSVTTCNQFVKVVRMALRVARIRGVIRRNPAEGLPPLVNTERARRLPFTLPEVKLMLKAANWEWRGAVLLGLYGGLRVKDATDLRWRDVDMKGGVISYVPRKTRRTGKVVVLPMHSALKKWMQSQRKRLNDVVFVLPSLAERPTGGRAGLSREFIGVMETAEVSRSGEQQAEGETGAKVPVRSFHSLRHTAASLMAKGGVVRELRMEVVGHSSEEVHAGYTHHEVETLRGAVNSIPDV